MQDRYSRADFLRRAATSLTLAEQHQAANLMMAVKVASVRLGTIGLTVWLMQRILFSAGRRAAGPPRNSRCIQTDWIFGNHDARFVRLSDAGS